MTGPITWEMAAAIGAVLVFAGVIVGYINRRLLAIQTDNQAQLLALQTDLNAKVLKVQTEQTALQLQVTREYASVQHLEKVENRLVAAIDRLTDEFSGMRKALLENGKHKPQ